MLIPPKLKKPSSQHIHALLHIIIIISFLFTCRVELQEGYGTDYAKRYHLKDRASPSLTYIAGDEFSQEAWTELRRSAAASTPGGETAFRGFNLVMSDALHHHMAVTYEFERLLGMKLLDVAGEAFAMVWDDCDGVKGVRQGHEERKLALRKAFPDKTICSYVFRPFGWMGTGEKRHDLCVLTTMDLPGMLASDALLRSIPVQQQAGAGLECLKG